MSGTIITTLSPVGETLSGAGALALSIAVTGGVEPGSGTAIYDAANSLSLFNQGNIIAGTGGVGVYVANAAAYVANQGYIGGQSGILGNFNLQNTGVIIGQTKAGVSGAGTIVNRGTILGGLSQLPGNSSAIGVNLTSGTLLNGLIGLVQGQFQGVAFSGPGSIDNLGTIRGLDSTGVMLGAGGSLVNGSSTALGALIYGNFGGVSLGGAGIVVNYGRIVTPSGAGPRNGIGLTGADSVINHGFISGFNGIDANAAGIVLNSGVIEGGAVLDITIPFSGYTYVAGAGVLLAGGTVQNSGTILGGLIHAFAVPHQGTAGAGVTLQAGLVINAGSISGGSAAGYQLSGGSGVLAEAGTIANSGRVSGGNAYAGGPGLSVLAGAYAQNSGMIQGGAGSFGGAGVLLQGGTLENTGSVAGGDGTSFAFAKGLAAGVDVYTGQLNNSGIITGGAQQHVGVDLGAGTVLNSGTIAGATGVLQQSGLLQNTGLISGGAVGVDSAAGTLINAGTIAGHYAVYMALAAHDLLVEPGALFAGMVKVKGNAGTLVLGPGTGTLDMGVSFLGFSAITLDAGSSWSLEGGLAQLAGGESITGFTLGDTLALDGFFASNVQSIAGTGLILGNATATATIDLNAAYSASDFTLTTSSTGSFLTLCYCRGTMIMTMQGEKAVESLQIGDLLPAYFNGTQPIKWLGVQHLPAEKAAYLRSSMPVRIKAGALGENLPRRDLLVSPGHAVLVNGVLLLAKALVNGVSITQDDPASDVVYYAIEFEQHDCLMAQGAWAESFADGPDLRAPFNNVAEFYKLYPDYEPPEVITLCAPRPEDGAALEAALRPVLARAEPHAPGALRGFIDRIEGRRVDGWAQDSSWPDLPQLLTFHDGEAPLGEALACHYRNDLAAAGIGRGRASFMFTAARDFDPILLRVRRAVDGAALSRVPGLMT